MLTAINNIVDEQHIFNEKPILSHTTFNFSTSRSSLSLSWYCRLHLSSSSSSSSSLQAAARSWVTADRYHSLKKHGIHITQIPMISLHSRHFPWLLSEVFECTHYFLFLFVYRKWIWISNLLTASISWA